jgi:hypothetical protein
VRDPIWRQPDRQGSCLTARRTGRSVSDCAQGLIVGRCPDLCRIGRSVIVRAALGVRRRGLPDADCDPGHPGSWGLAGNGPAGQSLPSLGPSRTASCGPASPGSTPLPTRPTPGIWRSAGPVLRGVWEPTPLARRAQGRQRWATGSVEVAEDPGRRGIAPKRCERVAGVKGHSVTVQRLPRCVSTSADYSASRGGGDGGTGYTFDAGGLRPVPGGQRG